MRNAAQMTNQSLQFFTSVKASICCVGLILTKSICRLVPDFMNSSVWKHEAVNIIGKEKLHCANVVALDNKHSIVYHAICIC
ncbi:RF4 protein [Trichinella spiralis]|uniref:RF4 protein n=1 Tax=Trichinella spiralis TaxID=6334 RepID=A0ABR3KPX5_TRISP